MFNEKPFNGKSALPEFPRDEVRAAIVNGIKQAEEQKYDSNTCTN